MTRMINYNATLGLSYNYLLAMGLKSVLYTLEIL